MKFYSGKENIDPLMAAELSGVQQPVNKRKVNKQMMERNRRARINKSLEQLKEMILIDLGKNPTEYQKLEKADILEMVVQYLQSSKPRTSSSNMFHGVEPVSSTRPIESDTCEFGHLETALLPPERYPAGGDQSFTAGGPPASISHSPVPLTNVVPRSNPLVIPQPIRCLAAWPVMGYQSPDSQSQLDEDSSRSVQQSRLALWRPF